MKDEPGPPFCCRNLGQAWDTCRNTTDVLVGSGHTPCQATRACDDGYYMSALGCAACEEGSNATTSSLYVVGAIAILGVISLYLYTRFNRTLHATRRASEVKARRSAASA